MEEGDEMIVEEGDDVLGRDEVVVVEIFVLHHVNVVGLRLLRKGGVQLIHVLLI